MAQRVPIPGTSEFIQVPDDWGPEEIERGLRQVQAYKANEGGGGLSMPQMPKQTEPRVPTTTGAENPNALYVPPEGRPVRDPSAVDPWGTWIDKNIRSAVRGTALGIGKSLDFVGNTLVGIPYHTYQEMTGGPEAGKTMAEWYDPAFENFVERIAAPQERGSTYEQTGDVAEVVGPAAIDVLTSGGVGAAIREGVVRGGGMGGVKALGTELGVKAPLTVTRDVGTGIVGGEVGGAVGEALGGEKGKALGELVGSAGAPVGASEGTRFGVKKALTNERSAEKLAALDRLNASTPPDAPKVPPSLGLVGNKGAGLAEDLTGRGIVSGSPAMETRRQQYEGIEAGVKDAVDKTRGTGQPVPATGPISEETIGAKAKDVARQTNAAIKTRVSQIQEDLKNRVGKGVEIDIPNTRREIADILADPDISEQLKDQAREIMATLARNFPENPPGMQGPPSPTPTYGKVKDVRGVLGQNIDQGLPLQSKIKDPAYRGMTEDMREGAVQQGIPANEFDAAQAETARLYDQEVVPQAVENAPSVRAAHDELFAGRDKRSVDLLAPMEEHAPFSLGELLADKLELSLRGRENAGRPVDPEGFNVANLRREWGETTPEFRDAYVPDPRVQQQLDDAATLARADEVRPGKRTIPGRGASTMGATIAQLGIPAGLGAGLGAVLNPGSLATMLAGAVTPAIANLVAGKALTNPRTTRSLVEGRGLGEILSSVLRKGGRGVSGEVGFNEMQSQDAARQAEERRKVMELLGVK